MCLLCICLLAMHTLICVTFSLPSGVLGWLRLLLVALPGLFCLPFFLYVAHDEQVNFNVKHFSYYSLNQKKKSLGTNQTKFCVSSIYFHFSKNL